MGLAASGHNPKHDPVCCAPCSVCRIAGVQIAHEQAAAAAAAAQADAASSLAAVKARLPQPAPAPAPAPEASSANAEHAPDSHSGQGAEAVDGDSGLADADAALQGARVPPLQLHQLAAVQQEVVLTPEQRRALTEAQASARAADAQLEAASAAAAAAGKAHVAPAWPCKAKPRHIWTCKGWDFMPHAACSACCMPTACVGFLRHLSLHATLV